MKMCALFMLLLCFPLGAALSPLPKEVQFAEGELKIDVQTAVIAPKALEVPGKILAAALQKTTGFAHRVRTPREIGRMVLRRAVRLEIVKMEKAEAYRLEITPEGVSIKGSDHAGLVYGVQTFVQMLPVANQPFPRVTIPSQTINDWPETAERIFHLDVSAHLFPTAELKGLIDWLSFHKINQFHLQLNGDAGWRMESLKFPKLHEIGSVRASTPPLGDPTGSDSIEYGGYYPQANLRELAEYGEKRGVEIVPAFSFVTGASSLIAAYPELGNTPQKVATTWEDRHVGIVQTEESLKFLSEFFAEVAEVFPSQTIRLEGDGGEFHEKLKASLARTKQELFLVNGIPTTNFAIYSRPAEAELLVSPKLRAEEGLNSLREVYHLKSGELAQATLRTRYVSDIAKLQYLVFPRLAAFAEATWAAAEQKKYDDFQSRVNDLVKRYHVMKVQSSEPYDLPSGEVKGGAVVTSSLSGRELHGAAMIFDGRNDSFFWSKGGLKKDDHLTMEFPWPIEGDITVATGRAGGEEILLDGVLDLSADGKEWDPAAEFFDGLASVTVPTGTRFARIRVFAPQDDPLVIHEVTLSEPILTPQYEETRVLDLPLNNKKVTLTFRANFEGHPELRDEIRVIRRHFFQEWVPLADGMGLAYDPKTPTTFEVKKGEPGELTAVEAQEWLRKKLIPQMQSYPVSSPQWFATGMNAMLRGDFPKEVDRSQCLEGGVESAAFLSWIAKEHGRETLMAVSQDCRTGAYRPKIWKTFTQKRLEELVKEYQEAG